MIDMKRGMIDMKSNRVRITAMLALTALLISFSLSSCTAFMKEASLETIVCEDSETIPFVKGFMKDSSINKKLKDEFLPAASQIKQITDASEDGLHVEYKLTKQKEGLFGSEYRVTMYLSDGRDSIELKSAVISGMSGVKPDGAEDLDWLDSVELAESAIVMKRLGIDFDKTTLNELSTERNAVEYFLKLYEGIAGREIDISDVKTEGDPVTQKAMLLELLYYYGDPEYTYSDNVYIYNVVSMAAKTLTAIERDVFGRQSDTVTGEELTGILNALFNSMRVHQPENSEHIWSELGNVNADSILGDMEITDSPFTRRDAAEFFERITIEGPKFSMKYGDKNLERVDDALDSIWVRRAVTHGFMNYYGDSTVFAPHEELTLVNAIVSAQCYLNTRYNDWAYSENYTWDGYYTNEDIIVSAAEIAKFFDDRTEEDRQFKVKTVINDRDYDWFFSQKNTGECSDVNCMPSIATMASHWYDENSDATVEKMRKTGDSVNGWYDYELRFGLSSYNVPYTVEDATLENIINALDNGQIVLAQYSDRPIGTSGHCYVIYGYRQFKDSTTFIVNDSDSLSSRAGLFGRKPGNGDEIEARFSMWSISRFVYDVTVISPND